MINFTAVAKALRVKLGRPGTVEPDNAVLAFALIDAKGNIIAQVDPATGQLATSVSLLAASGAITFTGSAKYIITKSSAAAVLTLAAPSTAQNGIKLEIVSNTAQAHTINAGGTALINDGVTGVPHTQAAFAAFAGASLTLLAYAGKWMVMANNNVTIS